jgi:hypothetical protein
MKPHHAAALALVGWYLMIPPPKDKVPNAAAPLPNWRIHASYDSVKECERGADELREKLLSPGHPLTTEALAWSQSFTCIASDDPRLARGR